MGEKYLGKHLIWQEGRGVYRAASAETPAKPVHRTPRPAEVWLELSQSAF